MADLNFLQQQFDLLKLVQENQLGAGILEGIEFGLGADPKALMDAMAAAMKAMIAAAEEELGIHSPSKWARGLMDNVMGTMAATVRRGSVMVRDSLALTPERVMLAGAAGGATSNVTVNVDARGAERGADRDIRRAIDAAMREYGLRADVRMRTGS
jgi:hypothetical protein